MWFGIVSTSTGCSPMSYIFIIFFLCNISEMNTICCEVSLQQYEYLVTQFSHETNFVSKKSTSGDAIHLLSPIGLSW